MSISDRTLSPQTATPATESGFQLVIERGQTRFPVRPIGSGRFLIGAGSNCQLQLGGEIPLLHSIIIPEADHLWIDAVAPLPQLIVNGQPLRDGQINRGDVLEIGDFVFCIDYQSAAVQPAPNPTAGVETKDRSAAELFQHLEEELKGLDEFEAEQRQAAESLQQAVKSQLKTPQLDSQPDTRAQILHLLSELHDRARALDEREAALSGHARRLAQSHEELRQQLELLCQAAIDDDSAQDLRKSA